MNFEKIIDKLLSDCKDYHMPACIVIFFSGTVLQWYHHMDTTFVTFVGVVLAAITGHAFSPAQKDPPPSETPGDNKQ
jgi:hypothetical protein